MKLYVGNLPFTTTEDQIIETFERYGQVHQVKMINDRDTSRFRGFAFVEMENGQDAIDNLNTAEFGGRKLTVSVAQERQRNDRGGDGRRYSGGGSYSGGGRSRGYENR